MITLVKGSELTDSQFIAFKQLLLSGGQIHIEEHILDKNIKNAELLAFYYIFDVLIAIGAVKNPQKSYRRKVFENANIPDFKENYTHEIGYFVTAEGYQGKGACLALLTVLLNETKTNLFATTKSVAMSKVFDRAGFTKFGDSWTTESGNNLILYTYIKKQ